MAAMFSSEGQAVLVVEDLLMSVIYAGEKSASQARNETKPYFFDVSRRLLQYETPPTLASATATLTDPDGDTAPLFGTVTVSGNVVQAVVTSAELTKTGVWLLDVVATLSNGHSVAGRFEIAVDF